MSKRRATLSTLQSHQKRTLPKFTQRKKALRKHAASQHLRHTRQDFRAAAAVNAGVDLAGIAAVPDMIGRNTHTNGTAIHNKQDGRPRLSLYLVNLSPE